MNNDLILTSISSLQSSPKWSPLDLSFSFLSFVFVSFFDNPLTLIRVIYKCLGIGSYNGACEIYH